MAINYGDNIQFYLIFVLEGMTLKLFIVTMNMFTFIRGVSFHQTYVVEIWQSQRKELRPMLPFNTELSSPIVYVLFSVFHKQFTTNTS